MIVTLYLNTQTEALNAHELFVNQWQVSPYTPSSMFCEGKTTEQKDFFIPEDFFLVTTDGKPQFFLVNTPYELYTTEEGEPGLCIKGSTLNSLKLKEAGIIEEPPSLSPSFTEVFSLPGNGYIPQQINNEWEIF